MGILYGAKRQLWRRRLDASRQQAREPLIGSRVLVVSDAGIGNAVEATPLIQAIRIFWPRVQLTVVAPGDLFADWCVIDRLVPARRDVKGHGFDEVFVTWACDPYESGEHHRSERMFPDWLLRPEREVNLGMLRRLDYEGSTPPLYVSLLDPGERLPPSSARFTIAAGGKATHRWRNKRWPFYGELVEALLAAYDGVQICIVGGGEDDFPGDPPESEHVVDLRGRLTLRETAFVLKNSDLAIGNDCGPMHVADAVLTPSLVLFGPTCEVKNGPRYRGVAVSSDAECSPCQYDLEMLDSCADPICTCPASRR